LSDTSLSSPVVGDSLIYNGTSWVNGPRSGNAIINGDFDIWQRGASFSLGPGSVYTADRWLAAMPASTAATVTRQSFLPNELSIPEVGDLEYYLRFSVSQSNQFTNLEQRIEDVRTFAGQRVNLSFWAKGVSPTAGLFFGFLQVFGSGGSSAVSNSALVNIGGLTSEWTRYSVSGIIPSILGKTVGSGSNISIRIGQRGGDTSSSPWEIDIAAVQLEAGSVATPFSLAGGGRQGAELALCQRYCFTSPASNLDSIGFGYTNTTTSIRFHISHPVTMRSAPTITTQNVSSLQYQVSGGSSGVASALGVASTGPTGSAIDMTVSSVTAGQPARIWGLNSGGTYPCLIMSAEL
jgi:hypothetical protein